VAVVQEAICDAGGAQLAIKLMKSGQRIEITQQAMELMNMLLKFGNQRVQMNILEFLKSLPSDELSHYLIFLKRVLEDFYKNELDDAVRSDQKVTLIQVLKLLSSQCQNCNTAFQDFMRLQVDSEKK